MTGAMPSTAKGRATRQRIVGAAARLVSEHGVAAVSLDDVQTAAGVSRSQVYHYFTDKSDLVHGVIAATTDAVLGAQDDLFADLGSWEGIDRWFAALVFLQKNNHARGGCPIGSLAGQLAERDPAARAAIADGLDRWQHHLVTGLQRLKADGELSDSADPVVLATATMACMQGGLLLTQVHRDAKQLRIALDAARDVLHAARAVP